MLRLALWASLGLMACGEELPGVSAPPGLLGLTIDPLVPGTTAALVATDAAPGATVGFMMSASTGLWCSPLINNACAGLAAPTLLGTDVADASGTAQLSVPLPANLPVGVRRFFQAVAPGRNTVFSDVVEAATESSCGDGVLQPGEACDDGGLVPGDGCSDTCAVEYDTFRITVLDALLSRRDMNGQQWDNPLTFLPDPDAQFLLSIGGFVVYSSDVFYEDRSPTWNESTSVTVLPGQTLTLEVVDYDDLTNADRAALFTFDNADLNALAGQGVEELSGAAVRSLHVEVVGVP